MRPKSLDFGWWFFHVYFPIYGFIVVVVPDVVVTPIIKPDQLERLSEGAWSVLVCLGDCITDSVYT